MGPLSNTEQFPSVDLMPPLLVRHQSDTSLKPRNDSLYLFITFFERWLIVID